MKADILIIGGGPAGVVAAVNAKKNNPQKETLLVREEEKAVIPCGIPYIFKRLDSAEEDILPDVSLEKNNIKLEIGKVEKILTGEKKVFLEKGEEIEYDKLVLATGSKPVMVPIKGIEKKNVWLIKKDLEFLKELRAEALKAKKVVIIGGGFIGVEIAEELSSLENLNVSIVERGEHCLGTTFDEEFAVLGEKKLEEKGVKIYTGISVEEIIGQEKAEGVKLSNGEELSADLVILAIGARPNVELAKKASLRIGDYGGIWVDEYMRTSEEDIFAVGDCAETRDFFTGRHIPVMLASTACTEARIAGANLYQLKVLKENKGTLSSFSTFINGLALAGTGMTEKRAKEGSFEVVVGESEVPNRHPGSLPGAQELKIKLIFSQSSGVLLGGQAAGSESVGEIINMLALAIQNKMTIYDLDSLQISTHPLLTPAPTIYPIISAAQSALGKIG